MLDTNRLLLWYTKAYNFTYSLFKGNSYFKYLVVNSRSKTTGEHQWLDSCLCSCVVEWLTDEWLHFKDNSLWLLMNTIQKKDSNCWCLSKTFSFDIQKVFKGYTCSVWKWIRTGVQKSEKLRGRWIKNFSRILKNFQKKFPNFQKIRGWTIFLAA